MYKSCLLIACPDPDFPPIDSLNGTDTLIANTGALYPGTEQAFNWEVRRYLYEKLKENPGLLNGNSLMQTFSDGQDTTSVGLLYDAQVQTKSLFALDSTTIQALDNTLLDIDTALSNITFTDSLMAAGVPANEEDSLLAVRQSWEDSLALYGQNVSDIQAQWLLDRKAGAAAVIAANNSISADSLYDGNAKALLDIYLNTVLQDLPLTLVQKALVDSIAAQCSYKGGYSTDWARAWHRILTGSLISPAGCDGTPGQRSASSQEPEPEPVEVGQVVIYPNPANGEITVEYIIPAEWKNAGLVLLNSMGNKAGTWPLDTAVGKLKIDPSNLAPGVYFLQILSDSGKSRPEKLIILK